MPALLKRSAWILAAALLSLPHAAGAQGHPQTREGFWMGLGIGRGSLGLSGARARESGTAGVLKIGGTINQEVLLGVEAAAWTKKQSAGGADERLTHANVVVLGQFYPTDETGFFIQAGVGYSRLRTGSSAGNLSESATLHGWGLLWGLGYDARLGTNISLTPYGLYSWGSYDGGNAGHFQLGAGVTLH